MLSQLTKTIKMALKSTEEERAILRARSAVQRFPVVEWRQRMEDFHKRSIYQSRTLAASNAWRESDCDGGGVRPMVDTDDWNPVTRHNLHNRNGMLEASTTALECTHLAHLANGAKKIFPTMAATRA